MEKFHLTENILPDNWIRRDFSIKESLYLQQKFGVVDFISDILVSKGINVDNYEFFINSKVKNTMSDPTHLLDIKKAAKRIIKAILNNEKVIVYGDYDVDGATSSALIKNYMYDINYEVDIYIPDRILEGYGPNCDALHKLHEKGYTLCIIVDSGIVAHKQIDYANSLGMDIIIVDHHISSDVLPNAFAVVNPNRYDQESDCKNLAAVGVSFLLLVVINKLINENDSFSSIKTPNLINYLDIVAVGTVCDLVPLTGLNRSFVKQGLSILNSRPNFGIKMFFEHLNNIQKKVFQEITEYHLGFVIGPHINAGGRVGVSNLGSILLTAKNKNVASMCIEQLISHNTQRKDEEKKALTGALKKIEQKNIKEMKYILLYDKSWHPGVIGIVAGRIKDIYHVPTFIIAFDDNIGKSSARSISGINIGQYILKAKDKNILLEGGGHAMAGGFSIEKENIGKLEEFFDQSFNNSGYDMSRKIYYNTEINIKDLNITNVNKIKSLSPFGMGNYEPRFLISNFKISDIKVLKESHIMFYVREDGSYYKLKAIAFNFFNTDAGTKIINNEIKHMICKVKLDVWRGREIISLYVEDIC